VKSRAGSVSDSQWLTAHRFEQRRELSRVYALAPATEGHDGEHSARRDQPAWATQTSNSTP
jgi:hypothetical protein